MEDWDGAEHLRRLYASVEGRIHYDVSEFIAPRAQDFGDVARIPVHDLAMITPSRAVAAAERVLGAVVALRGNQRRKLVLAELFADLGT